MTKSAPRDSASTAPSKLAPTASEAPTFRWALAAAAGLCLAACDKADQPAGGEKPADSATSAAKDCCHGKNACKGKGGCAVLGKNGCAGKNACKGQGGCNMNCPK